VREKYIGKIVEFTFPEDPYFSHSSKTGIGKISATVDDTCVTKIVSPDNEKGDVIRLSQSDIIRTIQRKKKTSKTKSKRKISTKRK
jgi:hypothetical protein